ncbi:hypothetical protein NCS56_01539600 [Fusarium sp. Ph1]|nr:hypothetical protein NCS56_01539600 [Fusarium sp. Ph1]
MDSTSQENAGIVHVIKHLAKNIYKRKGRFFINKDDVAPEGVSLQLCHSASSASSASSEALLEVKAETETEKDGLLDLTAKMAEVAIKRGTDFEPPERFIGICASLALMDMGPFPTDITPKYASLLNPDRTEVLVEVEGEGKNENYFRLLMKVCEKGLARD